MCGDGMAIIQSELIHCVNNARRVLRAHVVPCWVVDLYYIQYTYKYAAKHSIPANMLRCKSYVYAQHASRHALINVRAIRRGTQQVRFSHLHYAVWRLARFFALIANVYAPFMG